MFEECCMEERWEWDKDWWGLDIVAPAPVELIKDDNCHVWFHAAANKPQLKACKTGVPDDGGVWALGSGHSYI
jgi:hypothetical protein